MTKPRINFKYYILEDKKSFFKWCLEHELYKTEPGFKSYMKALFEGKYDTKEITAVIAYSKKEPIGLIFCENNELYTSAKLMSLNEVVREFDWGMYHLGRISIYVKEEYRNFGVATKLFNHIENIRLDSLKTKENYNVLSVPIFKAQELSLNVIKKKAAYSYVSELSPEYTNYNGFIGTITHGLIEQRYKEKYPMYKLRKRKVYSQETVLNKLEVNQTFENNSVEKDNVTNKIKNLRNEKINQSMNQTMNKNTVIKG